MPKKETNICKDTRYIKRKVELKVTAKITKGFEHAGHLKAYATICLADSFLVTGVRVVECEHGLRVFMPSTKDKDDVFHDVCFPIQSDLKGRIDNVVLNAYDCYVKEWEQDEEPY